uniref:riboflavin kinase n=1 Tax=Trichuris muris TaxID=70415 RepID=A0A5S6QX01_TRIMR
MNTLPPKSAEFLPYYCAGRVVRGFGRGSRQLGCPTANLSDDAIKALPQQFACGVYYGFANVDKGPIYEMVMSVGWNIQFESERKTMAIHLLHVFDEDFYGSQLRVVALGYLRPMLTFETLGELTEQIQRDIENAKAALASPNFQRFTEDQFFCSNDVHGG